MFDAARKDRIYQVVYGFILRYPQGKQEITGTSYEPWHYRYVGKVHTKRINELGICLEEYVKMNK